MTQLDTTSTTSSDDIVSDETPSDMTMHPIVYYKLQNHGAAVIHFMVKDRAAGRTVWDGGPTLAAGQEDMVDLSQTPGIDDKMNYTFGAAVNGGRNNTDSKPHPVDFSSDRVGVWRFTGTTLSSKVKFIHYEDRKSGEVLPN